MELRITKKLLTAKQIADEVILITGVNIRSKRRLQKYILPRLFYTEVCTKLTNLTIQDIGKEINRHHSTIIHYKKHLRKLCRKDSFIQNKYYFVDVAINNLTGNDNTPLHELKKAIEILNNQLLISLNNNTDLEKKNKELIDENDDLLDKNINLQHRIKNLYERVKK